MNHLQELICITCPKGCVTKVGEEGGNIKIKGRICKKGQAYIEQEYIEPKRILTTTVAVESCSIKRLPVRTREAIPKELLFCVMGAISAVRIKPPIKIGEVILADVFGTGVGVVATDDL
jgi:CxxC motif-containing protein